MDYFNIEYYLQQVKLAVNNEIVFLGLNEKAVVSGFAPLVNKEALPS